VITEIIQYHLAANTVHSLIPYIKIRLVGGGVQLGPLGTPATDWPIVPTPGDYDDGEFGGMKIGRENRSIRRKPAPAPLSHHKSHLTRPGIEPGPPRWKASD
jgi:hypothetical protein